MRLVHKKLICIVFVALVIFSLLCGGIGDKAYAAVSVSGYSNVLDDLQKDETFNPDEYPAIDDDYSLQVIQIAESTADELFVYVYQPAANIIQLTATSINMLLTEDFNISDSGVIESRPGFTWGGGPGGGFGGSSGAGGGGGGSAGCSLMLTRSTLANLYDLTLLNRNGVFAKYKLDGFTVSNDEIRYYNIVSVYRAWVDGIDAPTGNNNTINELAFPVGKLFTAESENGGVIYSFPQEYVTVTSSYGGTLRYMSGWLPFGYVEKSDSHYIAFDCDYQIDELYEVDISYIMQKYRYKEALIESTTAIGDPFRETKTLNGEAKGGVDVSGLFAEKYEWDRIQTVNDFINDPVNNSLSEEAKNNLYNKQWVLRFAETVYEKYNAMGATITDYTEVSFVTILRLHFKSNGRIYNLGVVSDKISGVVDPGHKKSLWELFIDLCKWLESVTGLHYVVWAIILLAIPAGAVLGILSIFISPLRFALGKAVKGLGYGVYYVGYAFIWLISRPFVGIKALIDKLRGN